MLTYLLLLEDSFIKAIWRRFSGRFDGGFFSSMTAEEQEQLNHEQGYDKFIQDKCKLVCRCLKLKTFELTCQ